jgi:molybdenum cofactor synthesis domain-containing protein
MLTFAILTISDRAAAGVRADLSGPALVQAVEAMGHQAGITAVAPDEYDQIVRILTDWADSDAYDIILTTGGTGFAPRDITPEATLAVIQKSAPGIVEAIRAESLKITPHAMLSRAAAGIRGRTLIINFPGSPKAAVENFHIVAPVLEHAVSLLKEKPDSESGHHPN